MAELIETSEIPVNIMWMGAVGLEAYGDKLIVLQDEFRSGMECPKCLNKDIKSIGGGYTVRQVSAVQCEECKGEGRREKVGNPEILVKCSSCEGNGWIACPACGGKGGTITTDKRYEGAPQTGTVMSLGPECGKERFFLGMRVMYPAYAGHRYDCVDRHASGGAKDVTLMLLDSQHILCRLHGIMEYRQLKGSYALHTME